MWFLLERFPLPLGAWDGLRYFIVALPELCICLFLMFSSMFMKNKIRIIVYWIYGEFAVSKH